MLTLGPTFFLNFHLLRLTFATPSPLEPSSHPSNATAAALLLPLSRPRTNERLQISITADCRSNLRPRRPVFHLHGAAAPTRGMVCESVPCRLPRRGCVVNIAAGAREVHNTWVRPLLQCNGDTEERRLPTVSGPSVTTSPHAIQLLIYTLFFIFCFHCPGIIVVVF
jgi:hypothetical protein